MKTIIAISKLLFFRIPVISLSGCLNVFIKRTNIKGYTKSIDLLIKLV